MMKKYLVLPVLLALTSVLSCCTQLSQGRSEIDKLFITRMISIDETQEGKVMLTLTTKSVSSGGAGQEQKQMSESIEAEGNTVFDAARNLLIYSDRRPHYGHTEYILFGEDIARKGIKPYLDFTSRHNEFRYNAKIYIVKGDTANSLVKKTNTSKMFVGDRLSSIEENVDLTSLSGMITLNEALQIFDDSNLDTFIPFIELTDALTSEGNQNEYDISLKGYALFRKDSLSYFTSMQESRGINWMMDRVQSGVIVIKNKFGEETSLEITDTEVKIKPRIEGNELHCSVNTSFTTNIVEIMGTKSALDIENVNILVEKQNKVIKEEIEHALKIAQDKNSDHFSIISKFIIEYPMMKDYFRENWKDLFPNIKFSVNVESNIKGTYLIDEPSGSTKPVLGE